MKHSGDANGVGGASAYAFQQMDLFTDHRLGDKTAAVPDASLLFSGTYHQSGQDLIISKPFETVTIRGYFCDDVKPALVAPDGSSLSAAVVLALTEGRQGPQYADGEPARVTAIGRVETVTGTATVIRNGQSVTLHAGELVFKGDAVETGEHGSLAITFIDGTTFTLAESARMVLNDMVYQPGGSNNSSLLSLVQGSITFVAGDIAHTGEMKVDTPVATMGIRGTAVHVNISAHNGPTRFSVMREPDGRVGSYILYDHTDGSQLATVSEVGTVVELELSNGQIVINSMPKSALDLQQEQILTQQVFATYQASQQDSLLRALMQTHDPSSSASHGSSGPPQTGPSGGQPEQPSSGNQPSTPLPNQSPPPPQPPPSPSHGDDNNSQQPLPIVVPVPAPTAPTETIILAKNAAIDAALQIPAETLIGIQTSNRSFTSVGAQGTTIRGSYGDLTIFPDGNLHYAADHALTLGAGALGFDIFTYTVENSSSATATGTLTFDVVGASNNPIIAGPVTGGIVSARAPIQTINLLSGATDPNPNEIVTINSDGTMHSGVQVTVLSGPVNASAIVFSVDASGHLTIDPAQFTKFDSSNVIKLAFSYTLADASGGATAQTATLTIDAPPAASYATAAPIYTINASATETPALTSAADDPVHLDTASLAADGWNPATGGTYTKAGAYGIATLDAQGDVTYQLTTTASPGITQETFAVPFIDEFGITTSANAIFDIDKLQPDIIVPAIQTLGIGIAAAISGVSLSESGSVAGETFTVMLTDTDGHLSVVSSGSTVSGSGSVNLTISGTLDQVNAALSTLTDTDTTPGTDTITLNASDSFGNSAASQTIPVVVPSNLVSNGGFETGDLTGWNSNGFQTYYDHVQTSNVHSGNYSLELGGVGSNFVLDQNISTTSGEIYQIEFWLKNPGGTPSDFSASFGGVTLVSMTNSNAQPYTEYTFDAEAQSSASDLSFAARQDPSYWYLDDISVMPLADATIASGAVLELGNPVPSGTNISFASAIGTLILDRPSTFSGEISGISGSGDVLDLKGFDANTRDSFNTSTSYDSADNTTMLTVTDSTQDTSALLTLAGNYTAANKAAWIVTSDGSGGVDVIEAPSSPPPVTDYWIAASGGDWSDSANWSDGVPVQASLVGIAGGIGPAITSSVYLDNADISVFDATIDIDGGLGGTLTLADGTRIIGGDIVVSSSGIVSTLDVESGADNTGTAENLDGVAVNNTFGSIDINTISGAAGAELSVDNGTTITGGTLAMGSGGTGGELLVIVYGDNADGATLDGVTVTNSDYIEVATGTVSGTVTGTSLTLEDDTSITGGTLYIDASSALDIEAGPTGGIGGAIFDGVNVADYGAIVIGQASVTDLSLTLFGGTVITGYGSGTLTVNAGDILDMEGSETTLDGVTINGAGARAIGPSDMLTIADTVDLAGAGYLTLLNGAITGAGGATLDNKNEIINGTGLIGVGDASLTLINEAGGQILSDGMGTAILLYTGNNVTNDGLIEANNGGSLYIDDLINTTFNGNGVPSGVSNSGTIEANGGAIVFNTNASGINDIVDIAGGGTVNFAKIGGFISAPQVSFTGYGTLALDLPENYGWSVSGFGEGDAVDLTDLSQNSAVAWNAVQNGNGVELYVYGGGIYEPVTDVITFYGSYNQNDPGAEFSVGSDAQGNMLVQWAGDDEWNFSSGTYDWSSSGNYWSAGTPTSSLNAIVDAVGTFYEITITSAETANSLTIEDAGATVTDEGGGSLSLSAGLTVAAGVFEMAGGTLTTDSIVGGAGSIFGGIFEGYGTVESGSGSSGSILVAGSIQATDWSGAVLDFASPVTGSGTFSIANGARLEFDNSVAAGAVVAFAASLGTLTIGDPTVFHALISGISDAGDVLDLKGFDANTGDSFNTSTSYDSADNTTMLTVTDSTQGTSALLTFAGNYTAANNVAWIVTSDGSGGVDVVDPPLTSASDTAPIVGTLSASVGNDSHDGDNVTFTGEVTGAYESGTIAWDHSSATAPLVLTNGIFTASDDLTAGDHLATLTFTNITANTQTSQTIDIDIGGSDAPFVFAPVTSPAILVGSESANVSQTLSGSAAYQDTIVAGAGNDTLTGNYAGGDTFVFKPNMGDDQITDLHTTGLNGSHDIIDVSAFHFANYQALLAATATDASGDATIALGSHTLTLDHVQKAELQSDLFHL